MTVAERKILTMASGPRQIAPNDFLNKIICGDVLDFFQIITEYFDAHGCANSGGEHVNAGFDRKHPRIGGAGQLHCLIQIFDEFLPRAC